MDPMYSQKLVFEGISVDVNGDGSQHHLDATVGRSKAGRMDLSEFGVNRPFSSAFKQATYRTLDYLMLLGYTREQALLFLTAAPIDCVSHYRSHPDDGIELIQRPSSSTSPL
jgi:formamidase